MTHQAPSRRRPRGRSWPRRHPVLSGLFGFAALWLIIGVAVSGNHPAASAGAAASTPTLPKSTPKPAPSARATSTGCTLKSTTNYIVRTTEPGTTATAEEIGNVDYGNCTPTLKDFAATAGQGAGECTTIALASDNPGYNVYAAGPYPPLRDILESAGPGC